MRMSNLILASSILLSASAFALETEVGTTQAFRPLDSTQTVEVGGCDETGPVDGVVLRRRGLAGRNGGLWISKVEFVFSQGPSLVVEHHGFLNQPLLLVGPKSYDFGTHACLERVLITGSTSFGSSPGASPRLSVDVSVFVNESGETR